LSTYGQAMVSEIDEALRLLNQYMIEGYDGSDIKNLLSKIASATACKGVKSTVDVLSL